MHTRLRSSASRSMACEASRCVCKKGARPARGGGDGAGGGAKSSSCSACGGSCGGLDDLSLGCRDDVLSVPTRQRHHSLPRPL